MPVTSNTGTVPTSGSDIGQFQPREISVRCGRCHHLLFRAEIAFNLPLVKISVKCSHCGAIVSWPDVTVANS